MSLRDWLDVRSLTGGRQIFAIGAKANSIDGKMTFCEDSQQLPGCDAPHADGGVGGTSCEIIAVGMERNALE